MSDKDDEPKLERKHSPISARKERKLKVLSEYKAKQESKKTLKLVTSLLQKEECERTAEEEEVLKVNDDLVKRIEKNKARRARQEERNQEREDGEEELQAKCVQLAEYIKECKRIVIYTGAGISTAASIPDYRGPQGVWTLLQKGEKVGPLDLSDAEPTFTHMCIAQLQKEGIVRHVVSQNCDGLHLRSGLPRRALSEVHGNMYIEVCYKCNPHREYIRLFDTTEKTGIRRHMTGRKCKVCGGPLRDTIVHFGEKGFMKSPYRWNEAARAADRSDLILCLGSSLKILKSYSCLWLMDRSRNQRPDLVIVNLQWTPKDDSAILKIHGRCDDVLSRIMKLLGYTVELYERENDPIFQLYTPLNDTELNTTTKKLLEMPSSVEESQNTDGHSRTPSPSSSESESYSGSESESDYSGSRSDDSQVDLVEGDGESDPIPENPLVETIKTEDTGLSQCIADETKVNLNINSANNINMHNQVKIDNGPYMQDEWKGENKFQPIHYSAQIKNEPIVPDGQGGFSCPVQPKIEPGFNETLNGPGEADSSGSLLVHRQLLHRHLLEKQLEQLQSQQPPSIQLPQANFPGQYNPAVLSPNHSYGIPAKPAVSPMNVLTNETQQYNTYPPTHLQYNNMPTENVNNHKLHHMHMSPPAGAQPMLSPPQQHENQVKDYKWMQQQYIRRPQEPVLLGNQMPSYPPYTSTQLQTMAEVGGQIPMYQGPISPMGHMQQQNMLDHRRALEDQKMQGYALKNTAFEMGPRMQMNANSYPNQFIDGQLISNNVMSASHPFQDYSPERREHVFKQPFPYHDYASQQIVSKSSTSSNLGVSINSPSAIPRTPSDYTDTPTGYRQDMAEIDSPQKSLIPGFNKLVDSLNMCQSCQFLREYGINKRSCSMCKDLKAAHSVLNTQWTLDNQPNVQHSPGACVTSSSVYIANDSLSSSSTSKRYEIPSDKMSRSLNFHSSEKILQADNFNMKYASVTKNTPASELGVTYNAVTNHMKSQTQVPSDRHFQKMENSNKLVEHDIGIDMRNKDKPKFDLCFSGELLGNGTMHKLPTTSETLMSTSMAVSKSTCANLDVNPVIAKNTYQSSTATGSIFETDLDEVEIVPSILKHAESGALSDIEKLSEPEYDPANCIKRSHSESEIEEIDGLCEPAEVVDIDETAGTGLKRQLTRCLSVPGWYGKGLNLKKKKKYF